MVIPQLLVCKSALSKVLNLWKGICLQKTELLPLNVIGKSNEGSTCSKKDGNVIASVTEWSETIFQVCALYQ